MLPEFLVQSFSDFGLGWFGDRRLERFAVGGQGFVQVAVNVLDGVKKVILNVGVRINGLDGGRISQPKINVKNLNPQAQQPKPAQDSLDMPTIPLFEPDRKEQSSVFIPNDQFPTFGSSRLVLVQMECGYGFFSFNCWINWPTLGKAVASPFFQRSRAELLVST